MSPLRTLALPAVLILSMLGFDGAQAAGDLTRRTEALPDLVQRAGGRAIRIATVAQVTAEVAREALGQFGIATP